MHIQKITVRRTSNRKYHMQYGNLNHIQYDLKKEKKDPLRARVFLLLLLKRRQRFSLKYFLPLTASSAVFKNL